MNNSSQLSMSFNSAAENSFAAAIEDGIFSVFIEVHSGLQSPPESFAEKLKDTEQLQSGLAFIDDPKETGLGTAPELAIDSITNDSHDKHLVYLSGRGLTFNGHRERLSLLQNAGFKNIIPITGSGVTNLSKRSRIVHSDGITLLHDITKNKTPLHPGCVVNPFKYTMLDLYPQYLKLIKKCKNGAAFAVTQAGWDMQKLQEVNWFLHQREHYMPLIARLELLTPQRANQIAQKNAPGITMSDDLRGILSKEAQFSKVQFEAAQWRRLQFQVAGAKHLGYSGIQLSGITTAHQITIALQRITEAFEEFPTFDSWISAYNEYLARHDMAPYPYRFYMYTNLLSIQHYNEETVEMSNEEIPECSTLEKANFYSTKLTIGNNLIPKPIREILKPLVAGTTNLTPEELQKSHFIKLDHCPKKLMNGPCGDSHPGGICDIEAEPCIHNLWMKRATWLKEINKIEESYYLPHCP